MPGAHEQMEHSEHIEHAGHHNKGIALLIAVLALFLAFSETLGKSAQTNAISYNVEASNLWAFFQAKTIRMTSLRTAAEAFAIQSGTQAFEAVKPAMTKQIDTWQKTAARYDDEPETGEGRKQLSARAKVAEHNRDESLEKYHHYEVASALFQIGIVLASAAIITNMIGLVYGAGLLGVVGLIVMGFGFFSPEFLPHLAHPFTEVQHH